MATRRAADGRWRRVARGAFVEQERWRRATAEGRHLLDVRALLLARPGLVVSHLSAAALHGLPLPLGDEWRAWFTDARPGASTRYREGYVVECAPLPPGDAVTRAGLPVTSLARTAADCLRHLERTDAVAIADAALRAGAPPGALAAVVRRQEGWPYAERCARLLPLLDGRRESWLESLSAVVMYDRGVPLAEPQVDVLDERGRLVGRVDGAWRDVGVVGEADGRGKYARGETGEDATAASASTGSAEEAARRRVVAEKVREDRLRDLGLEVVRWGTAEVLHHPDHVVGRWQEAVARARPERFRGSFRSTAVPGRR